MCYDIKVMKIIPSHKIRTIFRDKFAQLSLSKDQRIKVDVVNEVYRLQLVQKNYINMATSQKAEHPELATQKKLEELVEFKVCNRIQEDLYGQPASVA